MHRLLGLAAILAAAPPLAAQQPEPTPTLNPSFVAEQWSAANGLPVNGPTYVMQSRAGYLWLTTFDGIVRFDGARFTSYNTGNTPELPTDRFVHAVEAADSSLWFVSEYGHLVHRDRDGFSTIGPELGLVGSTVWRVQPLADSSTIIVTDLAVHRYADGEIRLIGRFPKTVLPEPTFWSGREMEVAPDGTAWINGLGAGIFRAGSHGITEITASFRQLRHRLTLHPLPDGRLLVGSAGGLYRLGESGPTPVSEDGPVYDIAADPHGGRVLVTTPRAIFALEGDTLRHLVTVSDRISPNPIEGEDGAIWYSINADLYRDQDRILRGRSRIRNIIRDREGSIWISSEQALIRVKAARVRSVSPTQLTTQRSTYPILQRADGTVLMGLMSGGLVSYRDGEFTRFTSGDGLPTNIVLALFEDRDGSLWVGAWRGACRFEPPRCHYPRGSGELFQQNHVRAIHRDRAGVMWFGSEVGLFRWDGTTFRHLTTKDGLPADWVRTITETADGTLWFGTNGGGLFSYQDGVVRTIGPAEGLSSPLVRAIHEDERGILWIGTEGRGLNRLQPDPASPSGFRITVIRQQDGLFDNGIHQVLEDGEGRLWMSGNRGISWVLRIDLDAFAEGRLTEVRATGYQERDGMRNREANGGVQPAGVRAADGRLWFPTVDGAVVVDPSTVQNNRLAPPVVVEAASANGSAVGFSPDGLRLAANQRDFEIEYTALSLLAPEHMQFRYRLVGYHHDWVEAGHRRTAFFTNVPPGEYTFQVIASNNDGVWNEAGSAITVTVARYFYETGWFRGLVLLGLLGAAILVIRHRSSLHRRRSAELALQVEARTADAERHRVQAEAALAVVASQAERLQRLDAAKSRFFANVSHEFRTPLTLTIGPLEDLRDGLHGQLAEGADQEVSIALRNARRLLKLVNELLDISKLDAGEMRLHAAPGDLWQLAQNVGQAFRPLAERRRIDFRIERPAETITVHYDSTLMERVIGNLLSNAFKFTPEGGTVRLRMAQAKGEDGDPVAAIEVRDSGPGIPEAEFGQIFERFYQTGESGARFQAGSGIGLSLTRELVELHHGSIAVESAEGFGTAFTVRLRLGTDHLGADEIVAEPPSHAPSLAPDPEDGPPPEWEAAAAGDALEGDDQPVVLVVDDNAAIRAYVAKHLVSRYQVLEADGGEAALRLARERQPDLILCDIMMPGMSGLDLLRELRGQIETDFIPVILLTAQASDERKVEGLASGADAYLTKPFSTQELVARVGNLIASRKLLRTRFRGVAVPPAEPHAEDPLLTSLRRIVLEHVEDDEFGIEQLAREIAMSRSHLYRRVHQLTGGSAADLLRKIRLERAYALLAARAGNVSDIAYAVGFKSLSHFSRSFRQEFGHSPSEVRAGTPA